MPHLVQPGVVQPQPGRAAQVNHLAAADPGVDALVAALGERSELINGEEMPDPVTQLLGEEAGIVGERPRRVLRLPPPVVVVQRLRQIPVVQGGERFDPRRQQLVDQAAVEIQTAHVRLPGAFREDPRPRDREPVGVHADVLHQRDVLDIAVVVIVGDIAAVPVRDVPWGVRVRVPDRDALTVLIPCALDLVGSSCHAPPETVREGTTGPCGGVAFSGAGHDRPSFLPRSSREAPSEAPGCPPMFRRVTRPVVSPGRGESAHRLLVRSCPAAQQAPDRPDLYATIRRDHKWRGRSGGSARPRPPRWCMKWPPRDLFPFKRELPLLSIQPH